MNNENKYSQSLSNCCKLILMIMMDNIIYTYGKKQKKKTEKRANFLTKFIILDA